MVKKTSFYTQSSRSGEDKGEFGLIPIDREAMLVCHNKQSFGLVHETFRREWLSEGYRYDSGKDMTEAEK